MFERTEILVGKNSNLLIIGEGSKKYGNKEINYETDYDSVLDKYGQSDLTDAFKLAKDNGVEDIFILNIVHKEDYFEIIDLISQHDFSYIVFTNLFLSDSFRDPYNANLVHSYFAYILGRIGRHNDSTFIVTDKHASLYETIDDFLEEMNTNVKTFKRRTARNANLENIVIVANNLKDTKMASIMLAAAMCTTDVSLYPQINFGEAIFHIDEYDDVDDYAYFKNHSVRPTTVENLINCKPDGPEKVVTTSRILKYIKRNIDLSEFKGRLYNAYQKLQIEKQLTAFLELLKGHVIHDYKILSIETYRGAPGTVEILCRIEVLPNNSLERCTVEKGTEVG